MITLKDWQSRGTTMSLLGRDIFTIDEKAPASDGLPVFFLHGFPTASWDFHEMWTALSEKHDLYAFDFLGFGFSQKPNPHVYSLVEQADLAEAYLRETGLNKFHVIAHDYGVSVAQELLSRQNAGTGVGEWQSVCFLNGGLFAEMHRPILMQKILRSPIGGLVGRLTNKSRLRKSMTTVFGDQTPPKPAEIDAFWDLIQYNEGRHIIHRLMRYIDDREVHRDRWVGALSEAKLPIAVINGSLDPVSGAHMVAHYKETVGDPDYLAELSEIGHYPQVEDAAAVLNHYRSFLSQIS